MTSGNADRLFFGLGYWNASRSGMRSTGPASLSLHESLTSTSWVALGPREWLACCTAVVERITSVDDSARSPGFHVTAAPDHLRSIVGAAVIR